MIPVSKLVIDQNHTKHIYFDQKCLQKSRQNQKIVKKEIIRR